MPLKVDRLITNILETSSITVDNIIEAGTISASTYLNIPGGTSTASGTTYNNTTSGLSGTTVQSAIDEVAYDRYPSGTWQFFDPQNVGGNPASISTSVIGQVFLNEKLISTNKVRMRVTTASPGQTAVAGIYKLIGSNFELLAQASGTFDLSITGASQELSYSSTVDLLPGIYVAALHLSSSTQILGVGYTSGRNVYGYGNAMGFTDYKNALVFSTPYTGTLPSTIADSNVTNSSFVPFLLHNIL